MTIVTKRSNELDFTKGILITLMVIFHLNDFVNNYTRLTQWTYTFHMSCFLLISGYLLNVNKTKRAFIKAFSSILYPYIFFETLYLIALSVFGKAIGASNHFSLTTFSFIQKIILMPSGTYWYLHTLAFCMFTHFITHQFKFNSFKTIILSGCILYICSILIPGLSWGNIIYFIIGCCIKNISPQITKTAFPSLISIIPIILISIFCFKFDRNELSGIGLTIFMFSFLTGIYKYSPLRIQNIFLWLGKNSLAIVLFSPLFTIITKTYVKYFSFDPTFITWAICSLILVISLCLTSAWICDKLKISPKLIHKNMYTKY